MADYDFTDYIDKEELDTDSFGEMLKQDQRTPEELIESAYESEGTDIYFDTKSLYSTLEMVHKNYSLLVRQRDQFVDQSALFWLKRLDNDLDVFLREYVRLLHNYAASVHTLTHHTYTFLDRYEDKAPELRSEYSEELAKRDLGKKVNLLKQIRHYTQKNWEPPVAAEISPGLNDDEDSLELYLERDEMLDWGGWSADVRPYLKSFDEKILITNLAEEYQQEIGDFYDWFHAILLAKFYEDISDFITANILLDE